MKNIQNFDEFVNEGIGDFISKAVGSVSKTFQPGELDDVIKDIFNDIKNNFDIEKLKYRDIEREMRKRDGYEYITSKDDKINVNFSGMWINDERVENVNRHYINDILEFFRVKYENKKKEKQLKNRREEIGEFRNKYSKYQIDDDDRPGSF